MHYLFLSAATIYYSSICTSPLFINSCSLTLRINFLKKQKPLGGLMNVFFTACEPQTVFKVHALTGRLKLSNEGQIATNPDV